MEPQKINSLCWKALPTPVKPYTFACGFRAGARVPTKVDPNYETTNLGCVSFNGNNTPYFIKTNVSDDVVYTLSYQLENGTVVFTLNKEFVITNAITNIFDEQTNYSVVNNLVNKETKLLLF